MTGHTMQTTAGTHTWREVIALLVQAADRGYQDAITEPAMHSTALAADGLASTAIALLPEEQDHELAEDELDASTATLSAVELIAQAERLTRRHPIEQLPPGASEVVVYLLDLLRETRP